MTEQEKKERFEEEYQKLLPASVIIANKEGRDLNEQQAKEAREAEMKAMRKVYGDDVGRDEMSKFVSKIKTKVSTLMNKSKDKDEEEKPTMINKNTKKDKK